MNRGSYAARLMRPAPGLTTIGEGPCYASRVQLDAVQKSTSRSRGGRIGAEIWSESFLLQSTDLHRARVLDLAGARGIACTLECRCAGRCDSCVLGSAGTRGGICQS